VLDPELEDQVRLHPPLVAHPAQETIVHRDIELALNAVIGFGQIASDAKLLCSRSVLRQMPRPYKTCPQGEMHPFSKPDLR